ncbi:hypothetical protein M9Y10_043075 [Tritrichomonas musculus]|uniref:Uncharacterized protein n=1 Tax=Tritrichomonas musculus TaxID=1915356 RepID=A0ABR2JYN6_9EUKA
MTDFYEIDNVELLESLMIELVKKGECKLINKLLRRNEKCNDLNSRKLNKAIIRNGYKFTKRNGKMTYIKSKCLPYCKKLNDDETNLLNNVMQDFVRKSERF